MIAKVGESKKEILGNLPSCLWYRRRIGNANLDLGMHCLRTSLAFFVGASLPGPSIKSGGRLRIGEVDLDARIGFGLLEGGEFF